VIEQKTKRVVIIGGGISGLSTAWYLQNQAQVRGIDLKYTLIERADRWGGKIVSERVETAGKDSFLVEGGPDSFLTQKPWGVNLSGELGIKSNLLGTNDQNRKVFVLNNGKPTPLPDGVLLIVPTKIKPFALSSLISPLGKARMGLDLFIPARRDGEDETLADFIRRRLGREALDKIAEPLMSGIYNAEAERQSILATFPRFRDIETKYGSLIKGMLAASRARNNGSSPAAKSSLSMFVSFTNGTEELVKEILTQLPSDLRLNCGATEVIKNGSRYAVLLEDGDWLEADAIVLAIPAFQSAELIHGLSAEAAQKLRAIRYVSTGTISMAFRQEELGRLKGFGLVIPRSQKRAINAVTFSSNKFNHRAPAGYGLLRVFFGGSRSPEMMDLDDSELTSVVERELRELLGIEATPLFQRIYRWHQANPQYDVGHLSHIDALEKELPGGIFVTGSPYRGIGIPDCIHQGQQAADKVLVHLAPDSQETDNAEPEVALN
jgi:oxygen-dependent protoporphyrinogen oxidase